jgi:hypothetical protein
MPLENNSNNTTSPTDNLGSRDSNNNPANQQLYTFPFNMVGGTSSQAQVSNSKQSSSVSGLTSSPILTQDHLPQQAGYTARRRRLQLHS